MRHDHILAIIFEATHSISWLQDLTLHRQAGYLHDHGVKLPQSSKFSTLLVLGGKFQYHERMCLNSHESELSSEAVTYVSPAFIACRNPGSLDVLLYGGQSFQLGVSYRGQIWIGVHLEH